MKAARTIWPVLLMAAGMAGWLAIRQAPQTPQARIIVENDVNDRVNSSAPSPSQTTYDPYFIRENRCECDHILILASKPN
jgi:hypothetical protein